MDNGNENYGVQNWLKHGLTNIIIKPTVAAKCFVSGMQTFDICLGRILKVEISSVLFQIVVENIIFKS